MKFIVLQYVFNWQWIKILYNNVTQISKIIIEEGQGPCMHFGYDIFSLDSKHINVWCYWLLRPVIAGHSPNMSEHRRSSILENEHRDWSTHFALIESRPLLRDRYENEQVMANIWRIIKKMNYA